MVERLEKANRHLTIYTIDDEEQLTEDYLVQIRPTYIFFPHWSSIIPKNIYENYHCIVFHMTDLPFGRGGSPLQNLIARGIYETKISAIQCVEELDAGPVYVKENLSLHGNAEEIFMRSASKVERMITYIIKNNPVPIEQTGEVVQFKRRDRADGNLAQLTNLRSIFDSIRMLDAEGYPRAYLEVGNFVLEFDRASLKEGEVHADVHIRLRKDEEV